MSNSIETTIDFCMESFLQTNGLEALSALLTESCVTNLHDLVSVLINEEVSKELNIPPAAVNKLNEVLELLIGYVKLEGKVKLEQQFFFIQHSSITTLQETPWSQIRKSFNNHFKYEEKAIIQKIWSSNSSLRQTIIESYLPHDLANLLEKEGILSLGDIPVSGFSKFCNDLTASERASFLNVYQNATHFSAETLENLNREINVRQLLNTFYKLELSVVEESNLLDQLKNIFTGISSLQLHREIHNSEVTIQSPWITFFAKDEQFCTILKNLVSDDQLINKFPRVLDFVQHIMSDEVIAAIKKADFPVVQEMLSRVQLFNCVELLADSTSAKSKSPKNYEIKTEPNDSEGEENGIDALYVEVFILEMEVSLLMF